MYLEVIKTNKEQHAHFTFSILAFKSLHHIMREAVLHESYQRLSGKQEREDMPQVTRFFFPLQIYS